MTGTEVLEKVAPEARIVLETRIVNEFSGLDSPARRLVFTYGVYLPTARVRLQGAALTESAKDHLKKDRAGFALRCGDKFVEALESGFHYSEFRTYTVAPDLSSEVLESKIKDLNISALLPKEEDEAKKVMQTFATQISLAYSVIQNMEPDLGWQSAGTDSTYLAFEHAEAASQRIEKYLAKAREQIASGITPGIRIRIKLSDYPSPERKNSEAEKIRAQIEELRKKLEKTERADSETSVKAKSAATEADGGKVAPAADGRTVR